jgi:hypothetical protein
LFYKSAKAAAKEGAENAERIAKDLSYHYKKQRSAKTETEESDNTTPEQPGWDQIQPLNPFGNVVKKGHFIFLLLERNLLHLFMILTIIEKILFVVNETSYCTFYSGCAILIGKPG